MSDQLATLRVRERGGIVMAMVEGEIDLSNASELPVAPSGSPPASSASRS